MIEYRCFRNFDPPCIAEIWNDAFPNRGAYDLRNSTPFERWVLTKPYFDPQGLILAVDNGRPVGFVHAGFGANENQTGLSYEIGVTCVLAVRREYQLRGIGSELLARSEHYLISRGAKVLYAGGMKPYNPFYFGLYGGSDSPGFLNSDHGAAPFLEAHGYVGFNTSLVFQRKLDQNLNVSDPRFSMLRRRYEVQILPRTHIGSWWQECVLGLLEPVEFRLEDKLTNMPAARALVWEMEGFSWRWNYPSAGIYDIQVRSDLRRLGLGKYLLSQILRYLQDQYFGIAEVQTMERNQAAIGLFQSLGFERVDAGRSYRKIPKSPDLGPPSDYASSDLTIHLQGDIPVE